MNRLTQAELDAVLFREWPRIQQSRAFGWRLPPASTHQWMRDGHPVGYATLDYKLDRRVIVPNAIGDGQSGMATIVEQYWAVRTKDGRQDPHWLPSLNVNVVHGHSEAVTIEHCETALRNAFVLRRSAYAASNGCFGNDARANCLVRAYVIGPEISSDVATFAALEEFQTVPIHVARYAYTTIDGFTFEESDDVERFRDVALLNKEENRVLGERFFADAILPDHGFEWKGVNTGPVFDRELGVTIQDGRVL